MRRPLGRASSHRRNRLRDSARVTLERSYAWERREAIRGEAWKSRVRLLSTEEGTEAGTGSAPEGKLDEEAKEVTRYRPGSGLDDRGRAAGAAVVNVCAWKYRIHLSR